MDKDTLEQLEQQMALLSAKKPSNFGPRLRRIFREDRPLRARVLTALLASLVFSFTFLLFGPIDLYIAGIESLSFGLGEIAGMLVLVTAAAFLLVAGVLLLCRGWLFDLAVSLVFGVAAAGYIQGNLLDLVVKLGPLDGTAIAWEQYAAYAVFNLLIWAVILFIPLVFRYFSRNAWTKLLRLVSGGLVGVQVVVLVFLFITTKFPEKNGGYLSNENMFQLSRKDNVVVFILDRFDNEYINDVLKSEPDFLEPLGGFTYFRNMVGSYSRTYPSILYMLTGKRTDYSQPYLEFAREAYRESDFLPELKRQNYSVKLLMQALNAAGDPRNLVGLADNVKIEERDIEETALVKGMLQMSAFRYAPHALKPSFWMYTGDLDTLMHVEGGGEYVLDDARFYKKLKRDQLTLQEDTNCFTVYHLQGPHDPYQLDENGAWSPEKTDVVRQSKGVLRIVYEYLQQMQKLGVYDQSTIIVTTDHGITYWDRELTDSTNPIFFIKPAGVAPGGQLTVSNAPVSQEDFQATVIDAVGGDAAAFGTPVWSWSEGDQRERVFWMSAAVNEKRDAYIRKYAVNGDANKFSNWTFLEEFEIKYPFYKF